MSDRFQAPRVACGGLLFMGSPGTPGSRVGACIFGAPGALLTTPGARTDSLSLVPCRSSGVIECPVHVLGRPQGAANLPPSGQILNIWFDVVGAGAATLNIVPTSSRVTLAGNTVADLRAAGAITVMAK